MKKIALSLIILLLLGLLISLGIFSPYNYFTASRSANINQFKMISINNVWVRYRIEKRVGEKYDIEVIDISNVYNYKPINYLGIKLYNKVMVKAYIKHYGIQRYNIYKQELDSTHRQIITY